MLFHLRWLVGHGGVAEASQAHHLGVRELAERTREQAETARLQAERAVELPLCATPRHAPPPRCNASPMLARRWTARRPAPANAWPRAAIAALPSSPPNAPTAPVHRCRRGLAAARRQASALKDEIAARVDRKERHRRPCQRGADGWPPPRRLFAELTGALAELTAKRTQLEANVRSHRDRVGRIDQDIANVARDTAQLEQTTGSLGDLVTLAAAMETAVQAVAAAETAAQGREADHHAMRQKLEVARAPLAEAEKRVQRLETEARTISSCCTAKPRTCGRRSSTASASPRATKRRWAPRSATILMRRSIPPPRCAGRSRPRPTPTRRCRRVAKRRRRTSTPRWNSRAASPRSACGRPASVAPTSPTSSRPVSGWCRWKAICGAGTDSSPPPTPPTGAARRLAERARLGDIEADLEQARIDATRRRADLDTAEADVRHAAQAESTAREQSPHRTARS